MNPGIITQARMGSTRLPGKVLKKIDGKTLLEYHLNRISQADVPVYVATTTKAEDDPIIEISKQLGHLTFRGSKEDVLQRYYNCARRYNLTEIVRVTSDCPLLDGDLIRKGYDLFEESSCDFLSNNLTPTYPVGQDFQIFSMATLERAHREADRPEEREHVVPFMRNDPCLEVRQMISPEDYSHHRITVDYLEDFQLIEKLIEEYNCHNKNMMEIIEVLENHPELREINAQREH